MDAILARAWQKKAEIHGSGRRKRATKVYKVHAYKRREPEKEAEACTAQYRMTDTYSGGRALRAHPPRVAFRAR